jgi:outer membrane receptor protein involved in Fe transport
MRPVRWRCLFIVLCCTAGVRGAFGQAVYGTIRGALTLETGAPITEARVLVSALDKGDQLSLSAQTDTSGYYVLSSVPPGVYTMTMSKPGYKTHEEPVVAVSADSTSEVNVKLTQGDPADKELGDGSAISILKIDRTDVSTMYARGEIDALPIHSQNISQYEMLVAGAVATKPVLSSEQNLQNGPYVSLSGQHFSGTTFVLDGTTNRDPLEGIVVLNPSTEAVSELKVITQNYGAEFGPATSGVVSMQTRSGSNALHGTAFGYRASGVGQASLPNFNSTSLLTDSTRIRNDFGGSLGGPLRKDRLFLFGDYRGVRTSADGTVLLTVPTKTVHDTCVGAAKPTITNCDLSEYSQAVKFAPNFPNGLLPNKSLSPEMLTFLNMIPLPNNGTGLTNNFMESGSDSYHSDNFDIRADLVASAKLKVFGRYSFAEYNEHGSPAFGAAGGTGTNPNEFAGRVRDRNQGIAAGFSYNLSSSLITDFRFGFLRYNLAMDSLDVGTTPATQAGINGLNFDSLSSGMPDIQLVNQNIPGLPIAGNIDFLRLGYSSPVNTCNCPLREREQQFQFVNNWTKMWHRHGFRWGADVRYLQNFRLNSDNRRAGHFQFSGGFTGFSLADFLLGVTTTFDRAYNPAITNAGERQTRLFFYGEDTWRVNSRLTVNLGLRWEIYLPQSVTGSGAGGWLNLGSGGVPADDNFLVAGQGRTNLQGNVQTTLQNFGPRLGLAYLVNKDTVIRAGYARAFDPGYGGTIFGIAPTQSPPVGVVTTFPLGFTVNSVGQPPAGGFSTPPNICAGGPCTVPGFAIPSASFTVRDLFCLNNPNNLTNCPNNPNPPNPIPGQQANLYALPRRLRLPTVDAWNIAMQHALDRHTYLEIAYVGNKGTHVLNDAFNQVPYYDLNQPTVSGFIAPVGPTAQNCQNPTPVMKNKSAFCKTIVTTRQAFQPWNGEVRYFGNTASSNYNSLQVKVRRQFTPTVSMLAAYTWSKILDHDNIYYAIDPSVGSGLGNFDRTHSFVMTNTWSLPFGRGRFLWGDAGSVANAIVGGWSVAAVTLWSSGFPFTPTYLGPECTADIGASPYRPCRPNLVGTVHITGNRSQYFTTTGGQALAATCAFPVTPTTSLCPTQGVPAVLQGFDTSTGEPLVGQTIGPWQRPGAGQIGDAGRNPLRSPGFFQADLSIAKEVPVTERVGVSFRADFFNVFNQVNLGSPQTAVDASTGGQITNLAPGAIQRQLQLSLRVDF